MSINMLLKIIFLLAGSAMLACHPHLRQENPSEDLLKNYARQSSRTHPGEHLQMYQGIPHSLDSLNRMIKCHLLHPMEARQMNIPLDGAGYDGMIHTAASMLEQLKELGHESLSCPVKTEDRLIVACYHHAMLLSSILRSRGIPVRMRAGYSRFYEKIAGVRFGHIICQVWDSQEGVWILVDPDRNLMDLPARNFDFAYEAWDNVRDNKQDPAVYTSSIGEGLRGIINLMILDASLIIKDEKLYWDLPLVVLKDVNEFDDLDDHILQALNQLSYLCNSPDEMYHEITNLYYDTEEFRPSGMAYETYIQMIMNRNTQ